VSFAQHQVTLIQGKSTSVRYRAENTDAIG